MLLQHKLKPKVPQNAEKLKPLSVQFSKKTYSSHHKPHGKYQNRLGRIDGRCLGISNRLELKHMEFLTNILGILRAPDTREENFKIKLNIFQFDNRCDNGRKSLNNK